MQFLMVLLIMFGVIVLVVCALLGVSYGIGTLLNSREIIVSDLSNSDPCARCRADRDWYEDLPIWKRNLVVAWWLVNRYLCSEKGCG